MAQPLSAADWVPAATMAGIALSSANRTRVLNLPGQHQLVTKGITEHLYQQAQMTIGVELGIDEPSRRVANNAQRSFASRSKFPITDRKELGIWQGEPMFDISQTLTAMGGFGPVPAFGGDSNGVCTSVCNGLTPDEVEEAAFVGVAKTVYDIGPEGHIGHRMAGPVTGGQVEVLNSVNEYIKPCDLLYYGAPATIPGQNGVRIPAIAVEGRSANRYQVAARFLHGH